MKIPNSIYGYYVKASEYHGDSGYFVFSTSYGEARKSAGDNRKLAMYRLTATLKKKKHKGKK